MERYEKYKDSGVEWIGEIPEGWAVKKFKYLYALITDKSDLDLPKIGLENIESETGKFITSNTDFEGGGIHFKINDILFGKLRPYLAKVYLAEFEGKAIGDFYVFRCENEIDARYSSNLILSKPFIDLSNSSTFGSKMPRVAWDIIANFKIAYPSLTEQTTIANYLDHKTTEIDQLITQKEHLLSLYEEEKTAIINQAVTQGITPDVKLKESGIDWLGEIPEHWEVKKLKYIANLKSGSNLTSEQIKQDGDFQVYGGNGLRGCYKNFTHDGNFVLIGRQGALCGNIHYAKKKFWATDHAVVATPISDYELIWFGELLRTMNLNQYSVAAAQPGLSVDSIKNLSIPFPEKQEQITIVDFIETKTTRLNTKITKTKRIIALQKEYRTALISEVVTGKIKVTQEVAS